MDYSKLDDISKNNRTVIEKKAKEYQEVFASKMLNIIFENVKFDPFSEKQSPFKSFLIDEYAKCIAPYIGIDKYITKSLVAIQEIQNKNQNMEITIL